MFLPFDPRLPRYVRDAIFDPPIARVVDVVVAQAPGNLDIAALILDRPLLGRTMPEIRGTPARMDEDILVAGFGEDPAVEQPLTCWEREAVVVGDATRPMDDWTSSARPSGARSLHPCQPSCRVAIAMGMPV